MPKCDIAYSTIPRGYVRHVVCYLLGMDSTTTTPQGAWTWRMSPELMTRLRKAQNNYDRVDIMTIVGFFTSEAQLKAHVERYEETQSK